MTDCKTSKFKGAGLRGWSCGAAALGVVLLAACETTPEPVVVAPEPVVVAPEPEPVVEIFAPEPVPSIDISEYERQQADSQAVTARLEALRRAEEAERAAEAAAAVVTPVPAPAPAVELTLEQRLDAAATPRARIAILEAEDTTAQTRTLLKRAYEEALAADRAAGNDAGAAEMLVLLGEWEDGGGSSITSDLRALELYAEAQALDSSNTRAPSLVNRLRAKLQDHADKLHEEAVDLFVQQDFAPAISRWEKVLLIDPGNSAARDWYKQSTDAVGR